MHEGVWHMLNCMSGANRKTTDQIRPAAAAPQDQPAVEARLALRHGGLMHSAHTVASICWGQSCDFSKCAITLRFISSWSRLHILLQACAQISVSYK